MSETVPVQPVAFVLQMITLHQDVNPDDFERRMLEEVFPALNTSSDDEASDQHFLLQHNDPAEYLWMTRLEYTIHQTPLPQWLSNRVARIQEETEEGLKAFGTRTAPQIYYDVSGWRWRLGK